MTIKDLGTQVATVWEGLRPLTKKMLVRAWQATSGKISSKPQKFFYDAHADWELSRLLEALDKRAANLSTASNAAERREVEEMANTCALVLQSQTESAEVFIQLAERALQNRSYATIDELADILLERFSTGEICEIVRQTENPALAAIGYETLALVPVQSFLPLIDDPFYEEIVRNALDQQAYEFQNEEARKLLDAIELEDMFGTE